MELAFFLDSLFTRIVTSAVGRGCREVRVRKSRMTARSLVGTDLLQEKSTGWLMGGLL